MTNISFGSNVGRKMFTLACNYQQERLAGNIKGNDLQVEDKVQQILTDVSGDEYLNVKVPVLSPKIETKNDADLFNKSNVADRLLQATEEFKNAAYNGELDRRDRQDVEKKASWLTLTQAALCADDSYTLKRYSSIAETDPKFDNADLTQYDKMVQFSRQAQKAVKEAFWTPQKIAAYGTVATIAASALAGGIALLAPYMGYKEVVEPGMERHAAQEQIMREQARELNNELDQVRLPNAPTQSAETPSSVTLPQMPQSGDWQFNPISPDINNALPSELTRLIQETQQEATSNNWQKVGTLSPVNLAEDGINAQTLEDQLDTQCNARYPGSEAVLETPSKLSDSHSAVISQVSCGD